jgi:pyruvate dehydrogenase E2 component (dihydrolipoamide acetyltransferase)
MAFEIVVPRLGWSMDECVFVEWLKMDGQHVEAGDLLFTLESEKAVQEIEAIDSGILRIPADSPQEGDTVVVGQVLGHLLESDEVAPLEVEATATVTELTSTLTPVSVNPADKVVRPRHDTVAENGNSTRIAVTPRARRTARQLGVDWSTIEGSGQGGRIRERDIRREASRLGVDATPTAGKTIPFTAVRRAVAQRMLAGVQQTAPVTLNTTADATNLVNLREQFKAEAQAANNSTRTSQANPCPTYTDLIVKLAAAALEQHPLLVAQWHQQGIFVPNEINIAIAIDTKAGLMAPVIRNVPSKSLRQVAAESQELAELAQAHRLSKEQGQGGTFTVTNLGSLGIDTFTPIINLPQCAVLGIGRIVREPVFRDREIVPRDMMSLSLTFDHRVLDGAPAARFLDTLRNCIEQPVPRLMP